MAPPPGVGVISKHDESMAAKFSLTPANEAQMFLLMRQTLEAGCSGEPLCIEALTSALFLVGRASQQAEYFADVIAYYPSFVNALVAWATGPHINRSIFFRLEQAKDVCSCDRSSRLFIILHTDVRPTVLCTEIFRLMDWILEMLQLQDVTSLALLEDRPEATWGGLIGYRTIYRRLVSETHTTLRASMLWFQKWSDPFVTDFIAALRTSHPRLENFDAVLATFPELPTMITNRAVSKLQVVTVSGLGSEPGRDPLALWGTLRQYLKGMAHEHRQKFLRSGADAVYSCAQSVLSAMEEMNRSHAELLRITILPGVVKCARAAYPFSNQSRTVKYDLRFAQYSHLSQRGTFTFSTPYLSLWNNLRVIRDAIKCFNNRCTRVCTKQNLKHCSRCKVAMYCSPGCQMIARKTPNDVSHKLVCRDWAAFNSRSYSTSRPIWPSTFSRVINKTFATELSDPNFELMNLLKDGSHIQPINSYLEELANDSGYSKRRIRNILSLSTQFWAGMRTPGVLPFVQTADVGSDTQSEYGPESEDD